MRGLRIAILDPHDLSRYGLIGILTHHQLSIAGIYADVETCEQDVESVRPTHLIISDRLTPPHKVEHVIERLAIRMPSLSFIIITHRRGQHYVQQMFESGAHGVLDERDYLADVLSTAIRTIANGTLYFSPILVSRRYQVASAQHGLSPFSFKVLEALVDGWTVQEAAQYLHVSDRTIYRERELLRRRLGVRSNSAAIREALARGWLERSPMEPDDEPEDSQVRG